MKIMISICDWIDKCSQWFYKLNLIISVTCLWKRKLKWYSLLMLKLFGKHSVVIISFEDISLNGLLVLTALVNNRSTGLQPVTYPPRRRKRWQFSSSSENRSGPWTPGRVARAPGTCLWQSSFGKSPRLGQLRSAAVVRWPTRRWTQCDWRGDCRTVRISRARRFPVNDKL